MKIILVLVALVLLVDLAECKKMWGSRKKRGDDEEVVAKPVPKTVMSEQTGSKNRAAKANRRYKPSFETDAPPMDGNKFQEMFDMYVSGFEELLESEDFDEMINPESLRNMMLQFPGAADVPELTNLMSMPELNDPKLLKATMREGLKLARSSSAEIFALLNDPDKVEELVGQLPREVKDLLAALRTGDLTALKDFAVNVPGTVCCNGDIPVRTY
jgi:hypothetical protein